MLGHPNPATDLVLRLLYGEEGSPATYDLTKPEVVDQLAHLLRELAQRAAHGTDRSPEELVHELLDELSAMSTEHPLLNETDREYVLRRIAAMARAGSSSYTIAAALNAEAVPSPHGRRWHRRAVEGLFAEAFRAEASAVLRGEQPAAADHPAEPPLSAAR